MKAIVALLLTLATSAFADVEISREEARTIPSLTLEDLESKGHDLEGKIIKVTFSFRDTLVRGKDNQNVGTIREKKAKTKGFAFSKVIIPDEGLEWFERATENRHSKITYLVFARVEKTPLGRPSLRLIGREIRTDIKGSRIVWALAPKSDR